MRHVQDRARVKRFVVLFAAGCGYETSAPPRPPTPAPVQVLPCTGEHTQVRGAWTLELLGVMPAGGHERVVYRQGTQWQVGIVKEIPNAPKNQFDFDDPWAVAVDRDGTVYFRGLWYGNPDQANNVGDGLYRLDGSRATPLVDPTTLLPGSTKHFNSAGGFSVDRGWVAFWGGRPYEISGVYAWHDGAVVTIADSRGQVRGTGTPSVHAGQIAFQGEEQGVRGVYLWSEATGAKRVLKSTGPIFGNVALADHVLYAGAYDPRRVIGWSAGNDWIAAQPEWFKGSIGDAPMLDVDPVVRRDDLVVRVAQEKRSELWNVSGCTLERIAGTGDSIGTTTISGVYNVRDTATLPDGDLLFLVVLADGSHHLVRAHRTLLAT